MYPKTFALSLIGVLFLIWCPVHANALDFNDPRNPQLLVDFDECASFVGGSQFDYQEFTADETNFDSCSQLSLVFPSHVYRHSTLDNAHSCTPGIGNSLGMCIDGYTNCEFLPGSVKSLRFNVKVVPGISGVGSIDGIAFFEQAPTNFNIHLGDTGLNNYPQFLGIQVTANGQVVYQNANIPTNRTWTLQQFDFRNVDGFTVDEETIFNFEILPYCPVGNGADKIIWDIDNLIIDGNCNSIFGGFISTDDPIDICASDLNSGVVNFGVEKEFGPLSSWIVADEDDNILQVLQTNTADFRGFPNGTYQVYHVVFERGITGLVQGANLENLGGCFDLSNRISVNYSNLVGGELMTSDRFIDAYICENTSEQNLVQTIINGQVGRFTNYLLLDADDQILESFRGPDYDFSALPEGTYFMIAATHNGQLLNSVPGLNLSDLAGCFELSNSIRIIKEFIEVGSISIDGQTSLTLCGDEAMSLEPEILGATSNNTRWVITNPNGIILNVFDALPIDVSNFNEMFVEIRLISFLGRLSNLEVNEPFDNVEGCFVSSNVLTIVNDQKDAGEISFDGNVESIEVCVDDGMNENIEVVFSGGNGANSEFIITNELGDIIAISDINVFNFEGIGEGICLISYITYDDINNLEVGNNVSTLSGCFGLSNTIQVQRLERFNCFGGCDVSSGDLLLRSEVVCVADANTGEVLGEVIDPIGNIQLVLLTDTDGQILSINPSFPIDVSFLGLGNYNVYALSSFDDTGVMVGDMIDGIDHDCFDISEPMTFDKILNGGGAISLEDGTTEVSICINDTIPDLLTFASSATGNNLQYVITDDANIILDITNDNFFDFQNAPIGICRVWTLVSSDEITLVIGEELMAPDATSGICAELSSNFIEVIRFDSGIVCGEIPCEANGGEIVLDNNSYCIGDGEPDIVSGIIDNSEGDFMQVIVTDADSTIIALPSGLGFDVESTEPGICLIFNLAYSTEQNFETGVHINTIQDSCFSLSPAVAITRTENFGGEVSLPDGSTSIDLCVNDTIPDLILFETSGNGVSYQYIVTDANNTILALPSTASFDFSGSPAGVCRVWGVAHNAVYNQSIGDSLELPMIPNRCFDFSNNFIEVNRFDSGIICGEEECMVAAGVILLNDAVYCVGDGEPDLVNGIIDGAAGAFMQLLITDADSTIISLPTDFPFDVDGALAGNCIVWHLVSDQAIDVQIGQDIESITSECFDISEGVSFSRIQNNGGLVSLLNGADTITICVDDPLESTQSFQTTGSGMTYQYVVTDANNIIVGLPSGNMVDFSSAGAGVCRVWGLAHNSNFTGMIGEVLEEPQSLGSCFDLSNNFVEVTREICNTGGIIPEAGAITLIDGTLEFCPGDTTGMATLEGISFDILLDGDDQGEKRWVLVDPQGNIDTIVDATPPFVFDLNPAGAYTLYHLSFVGTLQGFEIGEPFSDISGNFDLSNFLTLNSAPCEAECNVEAGMVTIEQTTFCVGDGDSDLVTGSVLGAVGMISQLIITDADSTIIAVEDGFPFDVDGAGGGVCIIWHLAADELPEILIGTNISSIQADCFDISEGVSINRIENFGGEVSLDGGTSQIEICAGDGVSDPLLFSTTGQGSSYRYIITDANNIILDLPTGGAYDFESASLGTCRVWGLAFFGPFNFSIGDELIESQTNIGCYDLSNNFIEVVKSDDVCDPCLLAQNTCDGTDVSLGFNDTSLVEGTNVCVPLVVENFVDIVTAQGGIMWDSTALSFTALENLALPGWSPAQFNIDTTGGLGSFVWFDSSGGGQATTIADGGTLFEICFDVIGEPGENSLIKVIDLPPTEIEVSSSTVVDAEACIQDGCVSIISDPNSTDVTVIAQDVLTADTTLCIDVTAENFTDISGMQFTMAWDSLFMCYDSVLNLNPNLGLFAGSFNNSSPGKLRLVWNGITNVTLPDGTVLFSVCVSIKSDNCGENTQFSFVDDLVPIEFASGTTSIPFMVENGSVTKLSNGGRVNLIDGSEMTTICVGDGQSDNILFFNDSPLNDNYQYVITDENNIILELPSSNEFDFENSGRGTCRVWGVSHTGSFDPVIGQALVDADADDCFAVSDNFIEIIREDSMTPCLTSNRPEVPDFVISPNPSDQQVQFEFIEGINENAQIIIHDMYGRKLFEDELINFENKPKTITIRDFPEGILFFSVLIDNQIRTKKLLVSHK